MFRTTSASNRMEVRINLCRSKCYQINCVRILFVALARQGESRRAKLCSDTIDYYRLLKIKSGE